MSPARVVYGAHAAVVALLAIFTVFGRLRDFLLVVGLFLLGFLLSAVLAVVTFSRRKGFSYRRTVLAFAMALVVMISALMAHGAWVESRWPRNRECLQRLADSVTKAFGDVADSELVVLDASGESSHRHPRSSEFAPQILACGMIAVKVTHDQIEFRSDELGLPSLPGGYVFRHRGHPELVHCPYILAGRDDKPPRVLEARWYYCRE